MKTMRVNEWPKKRKNDSFDQNKIVFEMNTLNNTKRSNLNSRQRFHLHKLYWWRISNQSETEKSLGSAVSFRFVNTNSNRCRSFESFEQWLTMTTIHRSIKWTWNKVIHVIDKSIYQITTKDYLLNWKTNVAAWHLLERHMLRYLTQW